MASPLVSSLLRLASVGLTALAITGCSIASSSLLSDRQKDGGGCMGGAGTYFLPRSVFNIEVVKAGKEADVQVTQSFEADPSKGYCLDFQLSPTAEETVILQKTPNGLLSKISSRSDDKSGVIAENIINSIFEFAKIAGAGSGDPAGRAAPAALSKFKDHAEFKATYDPLNPGQIALINSRLTQYGFCLLIWDSPLGESGSVADHCNHPLRKTSREHAIADASAFVPAAKPPVEARGLMYRPRLPYNYFLFEKRGHQWTLRRSKAVMIENLSPIVSLGIDRAFFAKRETALIFQDGALIDVDISKTSELANAVEIPMQIANGIASLPASIVSLKIDVTNRRSNLIAAQEKLLEAQLAYKAEMDRMKGIPPVAPGAGPPGLPDGRSFRATPPPTPVAIQTPLPAANGQPAVVGLLPQCRAACGTPARCERHCECIVSCRTMSANGEDCAAVCGPMPR